MHSDHTTWKCVRILVCSSIASFLLAPALGQSVDYRSADLIRVYDPLLVGGRVYPTWLKNKHSFYFTEFRDGPDHGVVYLVDPSQKSKTPLFNNGRVAASLSAITKTQIEKQNLPAWTLDSSETHLNVTVSGHTYSCSLQTQLCVAGSGEKTQEKLQAPAWAVRSPDGNWDAFVWNNNVYIRPAAAPLDAAQAALAGDPGSTSETDPKPGIRVGLFCDFPTAPGVPTDPSPQPLPEGSIALTSDGATLWTFASSWRGGTEPARLEANRYQLSRGTLLWSPDSNRLLAGREDLRETRKYPLYSSTSNQPVDHTYLYAAPGDEHIPASDWYILTPKTKLAIKIDAPPMSLIGAPGRPYWANESTDIFMLSSDRGPKQVTLLRVDPDTGSTRPLIVESSATSVEIGSFSPMTTTSGGDDIIWLSERDGWMHIYDYSGGGVLRNQIESGQYSVASIVHSDPLHRQLYFTAWGKAPGIPYYAHLYRVNFDGSAMVPLTPEPGNHSVRFTPDGSYFIDTFSTIDTPPVTVLRAADGTLLTELSRGDVEGLKKTGWTPAEPFTAKARDGSTDLYGIIFKPKNFDPQRKYPVIVNIYPGPQTGSVGDWVFKGPDSNYGVRAETLVPDKSLWRVTHGEGMGRSLAELGFIVVQLDAMGTARRSKQFREFYYGQARDNGLPDQIAAIKQLATRFSWIDANRVGVFGHSGGGYAAGAAMLHFPDFFKVGVSESGNHDFRVYGWYWGERYEGLLRKEGDSDNYAADADYQYASNLKGKLLLITGDMDCNNPPAETLRVVDALIKADKNFDMFLVPDSGHQLPPFIMKRTWDYFVTNLLGATPPANYQLLPFDSSPSSPTPK